MKLGKWEQRMLTFLECPASFDLILSEFSQKHDIEKERASIERRLSRMIAKGLITQKGKYYETALLLSATRHTR